MLKDKGVFGYEKARRRVSIITHLLWRGVGVGTQLIFKATKTGILIDRSSKNDTFGFLYCYLHLIYSRGFSLEKIDTQSENLNRYYNGVNDNISVSLNSRLIEQLKCNIRSINLSKYHISMQSASAFTLLDHFSMFQAETNDYLHQRFDNYLEPDQSALASGTLVGAQSTISPQFKEGLISTGLIHVVVASGYNLTIVTGVVQSVSKRVLTKRSSLILSLLSVWWYVFLALCNTAILRAGWMCSISLVAALCGRPKSIWRVLTFSILFLLAWDITLITNISFQLSIFSTIGVLMVNSDVIEDVQKDNPSKRSMLTSILSVFKENLQTTIGANLFTLPITLFWFGRVSVIALVANTLLLWIIPFIMYLSSIFLVVSQLSSHLGVLAVFPVKVLTHVFLFGVGFFASLPFASFDVPKITLSQLVVSYCVLFFTFMYLKGFLYFLRRAFSIFVTSMK